MSTVSNRKLPITPGMGHDGKTFPKTPMRVKTPRMSPSPCSSCATRKRRNQTTPGKRPLPSDDRFIPNRARLGSAQEARASLMKATTEPFDRTPILTPRNNMHERRLRRALFNGPEESQTRLLNFGVRRSLRSSSFSPSVADDPFRQDILRDPPLDTTGEDLAKSRVEHRDISRKALCVLDTPGLLQNSNVNVVSSGPSIAIGLEHTVYFQDQERFEAINTETRDLVTSVKWTNSGDGRYIAVGSKRYAEIWDPATHTKVAHLANHTNFVTSLSWKEHRELMTASMGEMLRHDLRSNDVFIDYYRFGGQPHHVTGLQSYGNLLAASHGNTVRLWDFRKSNKPILSLEHDGASSLEFCPHQSNLLATGGADGVKFWQLQTGCLRSYLPTESRVSSLVWSPFRRELMAAHGEDLVIWDLSTSNSTTLASWHPATGGIIYSLTPEPGTGRVFSLHSSENLCGWDAFGNPPKDDGLDSNWLDVSVLR